jgi:hypothetical protein
MMGRVGNSQWSFWWQAYIITSESNPSKYSRKEPLALRPSTFRPSALRLMPLQLHERVGKWTHEPQSNLNHKKHLSDTFICIFIFSTKLFRKYKNIFTSFHTYTKPKNIITASYLHYCIVIYLTVLHIIFYFYLHSHLVLDNHSVELGTQEQGICFADCSKKNDKRFCDCSPRFRYKPRVCSWGKFTLATTLCTWSPNLARLLNVINLSVSWDLLVLG